MSYIVFEQSLDGANDVEAALIVTRRYTIDRIIISKIVEYNQLCKSFLKLVSEEDTSFAAILKKRLLKVMADFDPPKWAMVMRNKASFHYDQQFAVQGLKKFDDAHPMRVIAGTIKGVTLFEFSEEIFSRSIFEEAGKGDVGVGMNAVKDFALKAISAITAFQADSLISAFKYLGVVSLRDQMDLRDRYCGDPSTLKIPLSLSDDGIKNFRLSVSS